MPPACACSSGEFSTPGGVGSHCGPHVPNSIHEGGELGYSLLHAYGAAFDNPDLIVACVVGDGEAETGPLEGSWKGIDFLNPVTDGAVLPILHLNGYKISGPTVEARTSDEELRELYKGRGYKPYFVEGDDPPYMHQEFARVLDQCYAEIREIQNDARSQGFKKRPCWPMIVLRTPKGWTGPKEVDGVPIEGTFRAHQVPLANVRENPQASRAARSVAQELQARRAFRRQRPPRKRPRGARSRGQPPHGRDPASEWRPRAGPARPAEFHELRARSSCAGMRRRRVAAQARRISARHHQDESRDLSPVLPGRDQFESPECRFRSDRPPQRRDHRSDRRPRQPEGTRDGSAQRALLRGMAGGLPAHRPPRLVVVLRSLCAGGRFHDHAARQVDRGGRGISLAQTDRVAQRVHHQPCLAQRSQRIQPSGAGLCR